MTMDQHPAPGLDFWDSLGVEEPAEQTLPDPRDKHVAGSGAHQSRPVTRPAPESGNGAPPADTEPSAAEDGPTPGSPMPFSASSPSPFAGEIVLGVQPEPAPAGAGKETAEVVEDREPSPPPPEESAEGTVTEEATRPLSGPMPSPEPDKGWENAVQIATSIRPRLGQMWLDVLVRETGGDELTARRVHHVLHGQHLIGELWQDKGITEVHIRGTRVTVVDKHGVREVAGFPSAADARQAVEAVEAAKDRMVAAVTYVGDSVVVSRRDSAPPTVADLVTSGAFTWHQASQVERALARMEAVTVVGPAARVVVRAFAALVPQGSRVYEGPYGVLPAGCVAAPSPLGADYVIGVRPGAPAEPMAAAGQIGALIANPETAFRAAVQFVVSGPFSSIREVTRVGEVADSADGGSRAG